MRCLLLPLMLLLAAISSFSQVTPGERAALQALYNALDGPNWTSENDADPNNDWDFSGPVTNSWYGLTINSGAVVEIEMYQNNFSGSLPTEIGDLTNLRVLRMETGNISGAVPLEINNLTLLQRLEFDDNQITSINITGNQNLEWLDVGRNLISALDVRQNPLLSTLEVNNNQLTNLDVSQNPLLLSFGFNDNSISAIDISANVMLEFFNGGNNLLTTLDISNNPNLFELYAPANSLTSIDLSNNNINYIYLQDNQLTALDLSGQTYLEDFSIRNNFISTIDLSTCSTLLGFDVSYNQLTELHLFDKNSLVGFDASHNQISNFTFSSIASDIEGIDVSYNDLSDHSLVSTFLGFSNLYSLNISNNDFRGTLPDTSLLPLDLFHFDNNRYQFGDLISHQSSSNLIADHSKSPQAKLNTPETRNLPQTTNTTMTTNCSGAYNVYQWYKDGIALNDGTNISGSGTDTLTIDNLSGTDSGVYHCEVNSTAIPGLTLIRENITLNVLNQPCDIRDRNALIALYNATDGPNWVNNTNWNTAAPLDTWFGVTTNASGCVTLLDMNVTNTPGGGNGMNGTLPVDLGYLFDLQVFDFAQQNLSGPLPSSIGNLTELIALDVSANQISGSIPPSIGNLNKLQILLIDENQLTGPLPDEIGNMSELRYFLGQHNQLSGGLPTVFGNLSQLETLWLYDNQLTGAIPATFSNLGNLEQFLISNNQLGGVIPDFWGNLPNMRVLWLGANQLIGPIPNSLSSLSNLEQLHLQENQLTGGIPVSLTNLLNLFTLMLGDNQLTGTIPPELGTMTSLEELGIYSTQVTGTLPPELGNLSNLSVLWLGLNNLNGQIPDTYSNLLNIEQLFLAGNQLTGTIPPGFANFSKIESFSISDNLLEGAIPDFSGTPMDVLQFENNRFQFGDFESQFAHYSGFSYFYDNPQAKVNAVEVLYHDFGDNITLHTSVSGGQNHYRWFKDGVEIPGAPDSPSYEITNAQAIDSGVYHCEITSDIVTDLTLIRNDITLNVGCSTPTADDPEDVIACEGYTLPPLSADNYYYTAASAGGTQLNAGDVINASQTLYVYTGSTGCSDENSFSVTIGSPPVADVLEDVTECESYMLPSLANGNYFTGANGQGTQLFAEDEITYSRTVYIYFESGSCSDETSFEVNIDPMPCEEPVNGCVIAFPKFFTPNSDGANDVFRVLDNPCSATGIINIYDRFGKLLYQNDISDTGWDGTFNGSRLPSTDYWYQFKNADSNETITGHFSLKR